MPGRHVNPVVTDMREMHTGRLTGAYAQRTMAGMDLLRDDPDLPTLIGRFRVERDWDQERFAQALGINQATVSKWERRISEPSRANRAALAELMGLTVAEIGAVVARTSITPVPTRAALARENERLRRLLAELEHGP